MFQPYLFFGTNCRAAFTRYQEIFGGELQLVSAADMGDEAMPGAAPDAIMHAYLDSGDGKILMGSDDPGNPDMGPVHGMQVCYAAADAADANRVFDGLAQGGTIIEPVAPTSWSPAFGMLIDAFGTPWMISTMGDQG